MKRIFLVLLLISLLVLTACGEQANYPTEPQDSRENIELIPEVKENKVVTLNGAVLSSVTDFEKYAKDNDYISAIKNEDNTVTLTMTSQRYEKMLSDVIATAEKSFSTSIQKNQAIKQIEHNSDLTELILLVDSSIYNYKEDTSYYNAYLNTSFYRMLDKPDAKCKVVIKDELTGEIIFETTYPLEK